MEKKWNKKKRHKVWSVCVSKEMNDRMMNRCETKGWTASQYLLNLLLKDEKDEKREYLVAEWVKLERK